MYSEKRYQKIAAICLDEKEKVETERLNQDMDDISGQRNAETCGFCISGATALLGSPVFLPLKAMNLAKTAYKEHLLQMDYDRKEDARNKIYERACKRWEKVKNMSIDDVKIEKGEICYA